MTRALRRDLGLPAAVSIVIGSMIGVGIFLGPRVVVENLGAATPGLVLLVWVLGGLFVFAGGLTYAELGSTLPESGGPYAYLREAYGPLAGFLTGWSGFSVGKAASISALAVGFAEFLPPLLSTLAPDRVVPGSTFTHMGTVAIALTVILILCIVNVLGVRHAGKVAVVTTTVKVGALLVLVTAGIIFLAPQIPTLAAEPILPTGVSPLGIMSAFGLALIPVFFAYDGWVNSTQVAEEVRDPGRNVPRSLIIGVLGVMAVYALANVTYLLAIGIDRVGTSGFAAAETATALGGPIAGTLIVIAVLFSIVGTINAVILSGPRIAFAMARDGLFPERVERISRWGTPAWSILFQCIIAAILVLIPPLGGRTLFDTLLTYVVVSAFLFYGLGAGSIIILRKKRPHAPRPYKVPLYPWTPLLFVIGSAAFLLNTFIRSPWEALGGTLIIATGLPIYWYYRTRNQRRFIRDVRYEIRNTETDDTDA